MRKLYFLKRIFAVGLTIIMIIALAGCNKKEETKATGTNGKEEALSRTINLAYDGHLCQAAVPVAEFNGFFDEEGLDVELVRTGGTVDNVRDAIAGGKIDASGGMIAAWLKPITNGIDMQFVVGLHTGCTSAFVLADSDITGFEKGQKVGLSGGIGGSQHNIAYRFIEHDGFKSDDFTWANYEADQLLLILQRGDADIVVTSDQLAEKWVTDGSLRRVRSQHLDEDFKDEACCVLGVSGKFVENNPEATAKLARAVNKAAEWIGESDENKREAVKLLLDKGYISTDEDYAVSLLKLYQHGLSNESTESGIKHSLEEFKNLGIIDSNINTDDALKQIWYPVDLEVSADTGNSHETGNVDGVAHSEETKDCCEPEDGAESEHSNEPEQLALIEKSTETEHHSEMNGEKKDCCE
jgi:NitT/TauT family transport system substrate-binding protein